MGEQDEATRAAAARIWTWLLGIGAVGPQAWRRAAGDARPSPRSGHGLDLSPFPDARELSEAYAFPGSDDRDELPKADSPWSAIDPRPVVMVLRRVRVSTVAVRPSRREIAIYTSREPRADERAALPAFTGDGIPVFFATSSTPRARRPEGGVPQLGLWRDRFLPCGSSVSISNELSAGTMGCILRDRSGRLQGLSVNHVTGACGMSRSGMPITAPGLIDIVPDDLEPFMVGRHTDARGWQAGVEDNVDGSKNRDAAIFHVQDANRVASMQGSAFDTPATVADPDALPLGTAVRKVGRTTSLTHGTVAESQAETMVKVQKQRGGGVDYVQFMGLVAVRGANSSPFARPGDSGALVVVGDGGSSQAIGIVIAVAGDGSLTYVAPLGPILEEFGCELVSDHNVD